MYRPFGRHREATRTHINVLAACRHTEQPRCRTGAIAGHDLRGVRGHEGAERLGVRQNDDSHVGARLRLCENHWGSHGSLQGIAKARNVVGLKRSDVVGMMQQGIAPFGIVAYR